MLSFLLLSFPIATTAAAAAVPIRPDGTNLTQYVDVFIGTGSNGNTFPGATVPFGMVQFSPMMDKKVKAWKWNSGYHRENYVRASRIAGFGLTALSGTGLKAGGDFIFLPGVAWDGAALGDTAKLFHDSEKASPGYYASTLEIPSSVRTQATVELTAGKRTGMFRVLFDSQVQGRLEHTLLLNLASPEDKLMNSLLEQVGPTKLQARRSARHVHHCGTPHNAFAYFETSIPVSTVEMMKPGLWQMTFDEPIAELTVRVGLSYVDMAGAMNNLQKELSDSWDFEAMSSAARNSWNAALARTSVSGDYDLMRRYYSALYHTMLGPTLFSDADRRYRLGESEPKVASDFDFYSTFSLWDTYRAEHPLLNLLFPEMAPHFVKSLLAMEKHQGSLPRWVLYGQDTKCMVGYPAVNIISEASLKGLLRPQAQEATVLAEDTTASALEREALHASVRTSRQSEDGSTLDKLKAIESDVSEGMSRGLEYAWSDSCISRLASRLGETAMQNHYENRSHLYRTYFHPYHRMLLPRIGDHFFHLKGNVVDQSSKRFYVEGSPLQYSFMVPHDISGFIEMLGTEAALERKLDEYFSAKFEDKSSDLDGWHAEDLSTGHYGGHVQGNEPGHHIPYLYNSADKPWKTQETVDHLMAMYTANRSGLPGNDDVGQMSAWFVFSALGFYPVDPCSGKYEIGRPLVDHATLKLQHGNLTIGVHNQAPQNKYVAGMSWNGALLGTTNLQHDSIVHGGELLFELGSLRADFRDKIAPPLPKTVEIGLDAFGGQRMMRREVRKDRQKGTGFTIGRDAEAEENVRK